MVGGISAASRMDLAAVVGAGRQFVSVADVAGELRISRGEAAQRLARWGRQGWLRRVRRDLYVAVPVDVANPTAWTVDPLVLADELWAPCYVTGWTAANHWGLTDQTFRTTIIKTTQRVRHRVVVLLDNEYLLVHASPDSLSWGIRREWRNERQLKFADPARVVVDMLDDPRLAGGIRLAAEVMVAYLESEPIEALIAQADRLGNRTVFKRLGYLGQALSAPDELIAACAARLSSGFPLLDPTLPAAPSRRSASWKLVINARVHEVEPS